MTGIGAGLATLFAVLFAGLYVVLSAFAQALEGLSAIRRKALLEEHPERFMSLLAPDRFHVSRIAVRLAAQGAVLLGLLATGTALAASGVGEPWLVAAGAILLGWIAIEALIIRWVTRREPDAVLEALGWLVPVAVLGATPLQPLLVRLVAREPEESEPGPGDGGGDKEEATKDAEVRALLDVAREEGILEKHEEELVVRAVDFGDRIVREVMTPRPDIDFVEADAPLPAVADLFERTKHTRIPAVEGGIDHPVGIVHVKDVFTVLRSPDPPASARALARPVLFAPETQTVTMLLADFKRRRQPLAIVVDEYGAVTGLVTLDDVVEELVGEIADEHEDEIPPVVELSGGSWSVSGRLRVDELAARIGVTLPPAEYDTVAGLVSQKLGRIPKAGESAAEGDLVFTVEEADRRRIYRVRVSRANAVPEAAR